MLADNKGKVCDWENVSGDGCCAQALPDSCKGCDMVCASLSADRMRQRLPGGTPVSSTTSDLPNRPQQASGCCFEYEFCVACCQQSNFTSSGGWRTEFRTPGRVRSAAGRSSLSCPFLINGDDSLPRILTREGSIAGGSPRSQLGGGKTASSTAGGVAGPTRRARCGDQPFSPAQPRPFFPRAAERIAPHPLRDVTHAALHKWPRSLAGARKHVRELEPPLLRRGGFPVPDATTAAGASGDDDRSGGQAGAKLHGGLRGPQADMHGAGAGRTHSPSRGAVWFAALGALFASLSRVFIPSQTAGLALLNSCEWLRDRFPCEAGCDVRRG